MAKKPCSYSPQCPEPAAVGGRCIKHAKRYESSKTATYTDPERRAIYKSRQWQGARRATLERDPFCSDGCGRVSDTADHVKPLRQVLAEGGDPFDMQNLSGVCASCHSKRTRLEQQGKKGTQ